MKRAITTMDRRAIITDPTIMFDYLMGVYCTARKSGSTLFNKQTHSFAYTAGLYNTDPDRMAAQAARDLKAMASDYFDDITIRCRAVQDADDRWTLVFSGTIVNEGKEYPLMTSVRRTDGITLKVT